MTRPATASALREGAQAVADAAPDTPLPKVEHATIAGALVAALAGLIVVERSGEGNYGSYADLADLGKVAKPALARHGMTYMQDLHAHGDGLAVTTTLLHESGEQVKHGPLAFPHGQNAQATGSYITYMRRYSLAAALGLAPGDSDDDGAAAKPRQAEPPQPAHPSYVTDLMTTTDGLSEGQRTALRDWLKEEGLPDRPSKMNAEQAARVCDYIANGLPKDEPPAEAET